MNDDSCNDSFLKIRCDNKYSLLSCYSWGQLQYVMVNCLETQQDLSTVYEEYPALFNPFKRLHAEMCGILKPVVLNSLLQRLD